MTPQQLKTENDHRLRAATTEYDPIQGRGSIGRRVWNLQFHAFVPESMLLDPDLPKARSRGARERLRCRHDFEFWAARCVKIRHKLTGRDVPFRLNRPQRRVAAMLEADREAQRPLRLIMLKARQWGGSTLVQTYMAWIQLVHRHNWNSIICAHVKDTAATIRGMYSKLLAKYPREIWDEETLPGFKGFEGSANTRIITGRNCCVTVGSAENQEGVRGLDASMAHLSEVAFWKDTPQRSAPDFAQAVMSGIPLEPYTLIAMESTANGVGNYFHREWLRAEAGESNMRPVFVPWHEIEMYSMAVTDPMKVWEEMDDYERRLWDTGDVTLEQIHWYHCKRREMADHSSMMAEFPSTAEEAFISTGHGVFDRSHVAALRAGCSKPIVVGEIAGRSVSGRDALKDVRLYEDTKGRLKVWVPRAPQGLHSRYVVVVDVGGRSEKSDFSVIAVFEQRSNDLPRVVAQWRGHIDHDLLGWKAAAIARYYHNALLVIESNTLETEWDGNSTFILDTLTHSYGNIYYRTVRDKDRLTVEKRAGFHTNVATKSLVIASLVAMVRDGGYVEADEDACNELDTYELTPRGGYQAKPGCHDDILMTRAIGLYVISTRASYEVVEITV